jgi:DNA polymerase III subunit gamma/tau
VAYQVLARKWRPQRFADVVGQSHVTTTLANAIATGRLAHAFLFCGPRGVGKTTTARILAKCLNCERAAGGPVPEPCNACDACREISQGVSLDVLEIDGASNRGIDEIRDLRENVRYAPSRGRAKVYVIDEVHMLTKEAFNALLKTLEEPPPSVYFVFATTEEHKVPATIRSRCQRYDFHRIARDVLEDTLRTLCEREGFEAEPQAIAELCRHADGGLRDAESLLDQAAATGEGKVTREHVRELLGEAPEETYLAIVEAAGRADAGGSLVALAGILDRGMDPGRVASGLAQCLRDLLVASTVPGHAAALGVRAELMGEYARVAGALPPAKLAACLALAGRTVSEVRRAERPRLVLEIALARMSRLEDPGELAALVRRLDGVSGGPAVPDAGAPPSGAGPAPAAPRPAHASDEPPDDVYEALAAEEAPARASAPRPATAAAPPPDFGEPPLPDEELVPAPLGEGALGETWRTLVDRVGRRKRMLSSFLAHGLPVGLDDEGLSVVFENDYHHGMVLRRENLSLIREEMTALLGRAVELKAKVGRFPAGSRPASDPAPARRPADPRDLLTANPGLKRVIDELGGQILPGGAR